MPDNFNSVVQSRQIQFSLRTALIAVSVAAVGFAFGIQFVVLVATAAAAIYFVSKGRLVPAVGVVGGLVILAFLGEGSSVQVRLDTGDQRICFWGVPVKYRMMTPKFREALLSLDDDCVPSRWVWCATQVGTNNADSMVYGFYRAAAALVEEDHEIAKLVIRDLAAYLERTHATHDLPECTPLIWPDVVERDYDKPIAAVIHGWQNNSEVQRYLAARSYASR